MSRWVVPLEDVRAEDATSFGHKGATLGELLRAGFPVPAGFAISGEAFRRHAERALGAGWWNRRVVPHEAHRRLVEVELDGDLVALVASAYERLGAGDPLVAVRSSSTAEDSAARSFAGIQESLVGVAGVRSVLDAMRCVWASLWSESAQAYLEPQLAGLEEPVMVGVVVQLLVNPDVAGVLFTRNPITGAATEVVINSSFGLGEPVLSGLLSPDLFVVNKKSFCLIDKAISKKSFKIVIQNGHRTRIKLDAERATEASLDEASLKRLTELGLRVEATLAGARDIEWALADGEVWLLQARPITGPVMPGPERGAPGDLPGHQGDVWTNANVGEALPGVATPLTWSIAARYSEHGFRRAFAALGCDVPEGVVLVARFRGRIYLNLTRFSEIAAQLPFLSPMTIAELGGARWPAGFEPAARTYTLGAGARFVQRLPRVIARLVGQNIAVERQVAAIEARVAASAQRMARKPLALDDRAHLDAELVAVGELLEATGDAMLTCSANSLGSFLAVRFLVHRWLGDHAPGLEHELLSGAADLESAKPGIALRHMAEAARSDAEATRILLETDLHALRVESFPRGSQVRRDLESFQAAHGYRAVREAELMTPRWSEEPTVIFAALREYLRSGGPLPGRGLEARMSARRAALERVESRLGPVRGSVIRHLVEAARRYSRLRERLRARVTQVLGLYRTIALEVSRRIGPPESGFFLTIDEVHRALEAGDGAWRELGPTIVARRLEYERFKRLPDPPATFVGSPPETVEQACARASWELVGLPASPGRASGAARVLLDHRQAGELRAGEVLVVSCADVGWSPLFLLAGALVTELGGVLSHAAVVAREYGVPAVVGVVGATQRIETGQQLVVDGDSGRVVVSATN
jgi:pyruvate,water dikinase